MGTSAIPSRLRMLALALFAPSMILLCASCGSGKAARKPTIPVEGKVFWKNEKTPAVGALVVFRPLADANPETWPEGFPRGRVGADGSFKLTSYLENDGAPAGEYGVLIQWPLTAANQEENTEEESGEDRLDGVYNDPGQPRWRKHVKQGETDSKEFIFIIK